MSSGMPPGTPPEFLLDRSLGKRFAESLRASGWVVHALRDVFPHDAQDVADEDWIRFGCERGWALLTKDGMIRFRAEEIGALDGLMFCLASGNLRIPDAAARFVLAQNRIHNAIARGVPGFWSVYDHGRIEQKWP